MDVKPFQIEIIKEVVFRDGNGTELVRYRVGDRIRATAKHTHYFVTGMGGIYFNEAREVDDSV